MKLFIGFLLAVCFAHFAYCTDYCSKHINCRGAPHVGCGTKDVLAPPPTCAAGSIKYTLTAADIQATLDIHNKLRNQIASGATPGFPASVRMGKLVWDNELAYLAGLNTRNCSEKHDQCRSTDTYKSAGQNLNVQANSTYPTYISAINSTVNLWFDEYKYAEPSDITKFSRLTGKEGKLIGHFSQVAWSSATAVGCGATMYPKGQWKYVLIACDYGFGNMIGQAVYPTSGAGCSTGKDSTYKSLCSVKEKFTGI